MADSEEKAKIEMIAGYPEEVVMQMLASGSITRRQVELAEEIKYSRGQRDLEAPQGTYAGGAYVAASPLSHLARGMRQYQGRKGEKAGKAEMVGLDEKYEGGMADALRAYSERMNPASTQTPVDQGAMAQMPPAPPPQAMAPQVPQAPQAPPAGVGPAGQMLGDEPALTTQALPQPPPLNQAGLPPQMPGVDPQMRTGTVTVGDIPPGGGTDDLSPEDMKKVMAWLRSKRGM